MTPALPLSRAERLRELVELLCSPGFAGRATGSPEGHATMCELERRFASVGLRGAAVGGGFRQPIAASGATNVLSYLPGSTADGRAIIVEAHYDHLGTDPSDVVYPGADDNAAALAILEELGREFASRAPATRRDLWICAFDAEEAPHFLTEGMGAMGFLADPPLPLSKIDMFICLDLCGHAVGPSDLPGELRSTVFALGAERSEGTRDVVDALGAGLEGVRLRRLDIDLLPYASDYAPFHSYGVPVLFLTCGRWSHYHRPTDTPDRLDYPKIEATVRMLAALIHGLDARGERTRFVRSGVDHAASVATLLELAAALAKIRPGLNDLVQMLTRLQRATAKNPVLSAKQLAALMDAAQRLEIALNPT